tara:strand:+ start:592 stop:792 length:201 start_codon:yes stop_codon:yes gene_type:complete
MRSQLEIDGLLKEARYLEKAWMDYFYSKKMKTSENARTLNAITKLRSTIKTLEWVSGKTINPLEGC